jgi:hypothetical protein
MTRISLDLPVSVHEHAKRLAKRDGVSIKQLISSALAEKMSVLDGEAEYKSRTKRANRRAYDDILASAPSRKPLKGDELARRK